MHRGHTWHDYPWPRVSLHDYCIISRHWFRKFTARLRPIRREIATSMYNHHDKLLNEPHIYLYEYNSSGLVRKIINHCRSMGRVRTIIRLEQIERLNATSWNQIKSKASLRLWLFCMMKYMHQYKQKRWKYFGFVPKIICFLLSLI